MDASANDRRKFIKGGLAASALLALGIKPGSAFAAEDLVKITILHTNDVHSHIDPFPMDGTRNEGTGGVAARSALIKKIRSEEENVLLLDAGDIFQGTPYFNFYGGELEMKLMTMMGYDAATMGNHDFDNGVEGFAKQLPHAKFPILINNYDFSDTELAGKTKPWQVFKKDGVKIGIYGIGIELNGLVNKPQYGNTIYLDPIKKAQEAEAHLKNEEKCQLIICLSHLGNFYKENKVSDQTLASQVRYTDLIIGGHTHTFLKQPQELKNIDGKKVLVNQVGWAGINLGRFDFVFKRAYTGEKSYTSAVEVVKQKIKI